jgi:hypothetical protein
MQDALRGYGVVMERQDSEDTAFWSRTYGWLAITSGAIGLAAFAVLITAVTTRTTWVLSSRVYLLFRAHDAGVILQFVLLVPLARGLQRLSRRNPPSISKGTNVWGVGAISVVVLLLVLGASKIVNDMFYMLPQGVFGAWLIVVNVRLSGLLPRWLRVFGMIVGFGLVLVGTVFPGLAFFVYPNMLKIPAVSVDNEAFQNTELNRILHLVLYIGSALGVVTLPIWTLLAGAILLRRESADSPVAT